MKNQPIKPDSRQARSISVEAEILLRQMIGQFKRDMLVGLGFCASELSKLEYGILHILSDPDESMYGPGDGGGLTITSIAKAMGVEPPTLVAAIAKLERKKLVTKTRDPGDRRRMPLVITPAGKALNRKIFEPVRRRFANAFEHLGEKKSKQFIELLKEIIYLKS